MTYIMTADGPKRTENIKAGDFILTASDAGFEAGEFVLLTKRISSLVPVNEIYETTNINGILSINDQRWATSDRRFVRAKDLTNSSLVISVDLQSSLDLPVYAIINPGPAITKPHSIFIEDTHTYLLAPNMFGPWYLIHD